MAQEKPLKGIVLEVDGKGKISALQGAIVFWLNTSIGAATDSNGVFSLPLEPTSNKIVVNALGFKSDTVFIYKKQFVKIVLISKTKLSEVVIGYERKTSEISFIDPLKVTLMSEKELFKAACCNLSESFETNPSVDVSYADALTGTKQIQMLGIGGQYIQITQEAIPNVRGIATNYGLNYTPGTWVNSIQVSKGIGSVANGYESVSGQINTQLHQPDIKEKAYLNLYASEGGRVEANLIVNQQVNNKLSFGLMLHHSAFTMQMDRNKDGYLDNPLGTQENVLLKFKYDNLKGILFQGGVRILQDEKVGGQMHFTLAKYDTTKNTALYGTKVNAKRADAWLKLGYVFPQKVYKSIGLQLAGSIQKFDNFFGRNLYLANQENLYANLIYQTIIGSTNHRVRFGASNNIDRYKEEFVNYIFANNLYDNYQTPRTEIAVGGFLEYTYTYLAKFTLVAGLRNDINNLFGNIFTPRIHARYAFTEKTVLRASAGKGWRTVNPVADNVGLLVSSRQFNIMPTLVTFAPITQLNYQANIRPEIAYNFGLNLTQDFRLNYRNGTISAEYYYTMFAKQLVVDRDQNAQQVNFYFKDNASRSHNLQVQLDYQPLRRFDVRIAYRYFNVMVNYNQGVLQMPLVAANRGFVNLAYRTKSKWDFDVTTQIIGEKRLPNTQTNPDGMQLNNYSPNYSLTNAQVTKSFKKYLAVYLGVENVFNFKQTNPIVNGANPFNQYFDASMVWGPVFGRMFYAGLRFRL